MNVEDLLGEITVQQFLTSVWRKKASLLNPKCTASRNLVSMDEIETLFNNNFYLNFGLDVIGPDGAYAKGDAIKSDTQQRAYTVDKEKIENYLKSDCTIVMKHCAHINKKMSALIQSLENAIPDYLVDMHLWMSTGTKAKSLNVHRDFPQEKIYLQLYGQTNWTIYKIPKDIERIVQENITYFSKEDALEKLEIDFQFTLLPGQVMYMPVNRFHHVDISAGPRISASFLLNPHIHGEKISRKQIPLSKYLGNPTLG
jgi:ribosomal protein L16 Arg81 hydroxylase